MLGAIEMSRVTSRFFDQEYAPLSLSESDTVQNMVDLWRQGDNRYLKMDKNRTKQGKNYIPKHKYDYESSVFNDFFRVENQALLNYIKVKEILINCK